MASKKFPLLSATPNPVFFIGNEYDLKKYRICGIIAPSGKLDTYKSHTTDEYTLDDNGS